MIASIKRTVEMMFGLVTADARVNRRRMKLFAAVTPVKIPHAPVSTRCTIQPLVEYSSSHGFGVLESVTLAF